MPSADDNDDQYYTTSEPPLRPPPPPPQPQEQPSLADKLVPGPEEAALEQHRKSPASNVRITEPHSHDVICDRGKKANRHAGNKYYHLLVGERKREYVVQGKNSAHEVVEEIEKLDPPGRFLKKRGDVWYEVEQKKALEKARQCLSEGAPELRQILLPPDGDKLCTNQNSSRSKIPPSGHSGNRDVHFPHNSIDMGRPPRPSTQKVPSDSSLRRSCMSIDPAPDREGPYNNALKRPTSTTCCDLTTRPEGNRYNGICGEKTTFDLSSAFEDKVHPMAERKTEHGPHQSLCPSLVSPQQCTIPLSSSSSSVHFPQTSLGMGRPHHSPQEAPLDLPLSSIRMSMDLAHDGEGSYHNASNGPTSTTCGDLTACPEGSGSNGICEGKESFRFSSAIVDKAHPLTDRKAEHFPHQSLFPSLVSRQPFTTPLSSSSRSLSLSEVGRQSSDGSSNMSSWQMQLAYVQPINSGSFTWGQNDSTRSDISNITDDLQVLGLQG